MIYDEIKTEATFPPGMVSGTAYEVLNYHANGEAADWALKNTGIIAMSPELASESITSFTFDIASIRDEARVIMGNLDLPFYLLDKASAQIKITEAPNKMLKVDNKNKVIQLELLVVNKGMTDANNLNIAIVFNDSNVEVKGNVILGIVKARSSKILNIRLKEISDETMLAMTSVLNYGSFA